ncbi:4823_t:CDS:2 [Dentiscutata erythropus]|uniref:Elongator complex protein 4 n=1 Tax=Dentiscutata erythropus TaxID=1348616 RepID=A0A9N9BRX8_9GLOM|nr:4823_t:CDS:2 [Dentiscutata erythropus]
MNNSSSFSSFKKNIRTSKTLPAARLSPYNGQLLLSTGVPSLDDILTFQCGGLPIGTILLIKEDKHTGYSKLLLKYFLSQGIASGHHVLFSSTEEDPSNFIKGLPWITNDDSNDLDDKAEADDKMKIAWRYKEMKKFESGIKTTPTIFKNKQIPITGSQRQEQPFCYTFDLTKSIPQQSIDSASITLVDATKWADEQHDESMYDKLLSEIRRVIDQNHFSSSATPSTGVEKNALRIGIHSIASPLWNSNSPHDLYRFFHALRGLLRNSSGLSVITIPAHLYTSNLEPCSFIRRIEHISDAVVELESFAGSSATVNNVYSASYHGLFHVHKLPTINSLISPSVKLSILSGGGGNNLGFKLRRKKFSIETFHLPPEGGLTVRKVAKSGVDEGKKDPYDF